jgi:hypothetical protein
LHYPNPELASVLILRGHYTLTIFGGQLDVRGLELQHHDRPSIELDEHIEATADIVSDLALDHDLAVTEIRMTACSLPSNVASFTSRG